MLETLAKVFFRVRESNIFFRESFAKVGYYNLLCKGLPPTAARCPAGEGHCSGSVPCVVMLVDNHTLHR